MSERSIPPLEATTDVATFFLADLRAGTVVRVEPFPQARTPAWKLWIDFGPDLGQRTSSARLTDLYAAEELLGRQVIALLNVPPRRIGRFRSECLVTGFDTSEGVVLATVERPVPDGARLY
jgi:tRNA-binding protein